jgi:hypothetical protein
LRDLFLGLVDLCLLPGLPLLEGILNGGQLLLSLLLLPLLLEERVLGRLLQLLADGLELIIHI